MFEDFLNACDSTNIRDAIGTCDFDEDSANASNNDEAGAKSAIGHETFALAPLWMSASAYDAKKLALLNLGSGTQQIHNKIYDTTTSPESKTSTASDDRIAVMA